MFCSDIPAPTFLIISNSVPHILYYSHIPAMVISLLLGVFVFLKSRTLSSRILLFISIVFSLWSFTNLIVWTNIDSRVIMFAWSLFGLLYSLLYILCLYFVYVFIDKNDVPLTHKVIWILLLLPVIIFMSSKYSLSGFNIPNCEAVEEIFYTNYYYFLGFFVFLWILTIAVNRYRKAEKNSKRQILFLIVGIELFLLSFFIAGFLASYLVDNGYIDDFGLEQYGLFGMTVFMGFLAYLIVRFKAFDIKMIGAQALVYALVILIGSQFFFIQNKTNQILTGITLAMSVVFGFYLIKSVKNEVKRKEELQEMTEKLAQANDQLRKLDNAKSEFISIASHQLRTPLTSIKGYASLILEGTYGVINQGLIEPLNKIYASNERLIQLVEELLNVSRIESGRMEYKFEKYQVEKTIKELYDTFSVIAKDKQLYLHLQVSSGLPEVEVDPAKTREIISNLIDNALKYTKRGGVTVKAETSEGFVRVTVSDTGIGIPATELPYLFSKFSRGKDTSRLHVGGTGLGLYVGKNMIEAQNGRILVQSDGEGKGSRFIVDLPINQPKTA